MEPSVEELSDDESLNTSAVLVESTLTPLNDRKLLKFAKAFKEASAQEQLILGNNLPT